MTMQWRKRAKAAKRAFDTGMVETDDQRRAREDAERIRRVIEREGVWFPGSHVSSWLPRSGD